MFCEATRLELWKEVGRFVGEGGKEECREKGFELEEEWRLI